ncbi:ParB/RepB/Spo0J family partition protein [Halorussus marinus]|uniref:ParB/RepB/Spo0J family partition protein n=1 Tax=Halorussus marinus TaxID=2505976 RepID=UPI00106EFC67|nr:ParB/RepB/Spo0J family partition protein [Halorussus marinus]
MEVRQIDPKELEIDPLNERNSNVGPHNGNDSLEESIREQGVIQPPVARPDNGSYKVIVGQRRTLAAQSVGLEEMPVIVVDWDDAEALEATITENVDAFRKSVSKSDRAAAISRLMELNNWSVTEAADELGINRGTFRDWLERTHDEWEDTVVHVDSNDDSEEEQNANVETHSSNSKQISEEDVEQISDTDLRLIRNLTDSPEERQQAVEKVVQSGATQSEIREAKKRTERGEGSFDEVIEKVSQDSEEKSGQIQVRTEVTFTGDYAEGLQRAAKDYGTSEEELIRKAINEYLSDQGYL